MIQELLLVKATPEHRSFIISTWLKSYKGTARKHYAADWFDKYEPKIAEARWKDCWVLTDEGGFTVYAWICGQPGQLLHCYVIPELRQLKVSKALVAWCVSDTESYELARPWPYRTNKRVNPYLLSVHA